ncbi:uncharacterized protein TNCV_2985681 [Trichonephila clavipes]|nr:uncharacterized protein TNCV_2985681 [Trichonephila clavipes]
MRPCIVIHKNEVWANGTSEQTHMGKKYLLTIAIPDYKPSVENVEPSSPIHHNASTDKNSRSTVTVSFLDVSGIKPGPDLSPNQNALRIIASGTEPTLSRKEDITPLISCPDFVLSAPLQTVAWVANFQREVAFRTMFSGGHNQLSNTFTCGLERFPSARNDTFVDSELCRYTGDSTPLLQLSDHSSTCEIVQMISSSHISRIDSMALAANMLNCDSGLHFIPLLSSVRRHHALCVRSRRF